jgi:hypothetical protein
MEGLVKNNSNNPESPYAREGELTAKLLELLHSPFGVCLSRIVDELHSLLPRSRASG